MVQRVVVLAIGLVVATGGFARAGGEREIDFAGGLTYNQSPGSDLEDFPGLAIEARFYRGSAFLAALLSSDLGFDLRNPEAGNPVPLLGVGVGAGWHQQLGGNLLGLLGGRVEWLNAWGWPDPAGGQYDFHSGLRGGPCASMVLTIGSMWGHPMSLEARASYLFYRVPEGDEEPAGSYRGWRGGLFLTGVLFPEPGGVGK